MQDNDLPLTLQSLCLDVVNENPSLRVSNDSIGITAPEDWLKGETRHYDGMLHYR